MSSTNPVALGAAAVGVSTSAARGDHVHPTTGLSLSGHTHDYSASTHNHDAAYVNTTGDTMTGDLVVSKTTPRIQLYQDVSNVVSLGISGVKLAVRNSANNALTQAQAADPLVAADVATKGYVDTADGTKAASSHTHAYMPTAGGIFTGRVQIDTSEGLTLHNDNADGGQNSVNSIGSKWEGGRYCIEVTDGWSADVGSLAPIQIGTPINGNSAARVDWVQADRAAASHGAHFANGASGVYAVDGNGNAVVYPGVWFTVPMPVNGDFPAHARAPHVHSWANGSHFWTTNQNAGQNIRLNWIVF